MRAKSWIVIAAAMVAPICAQAAESSAPLLFVIHFEIGPKWDKSLASADQPGFKEHAANLNRLRQEGKIVFGARYDEFGMIVIKAAALEAAKALIDVDPGVRSQLFTYRIAALNVFYPWQP